MEKAKTLAFESHASNSGMMATLRVGGEDKNIAIILDDSIDVDPDPVVIDAIEELMNDMFTNPDLLIDILHVYPNTYKKLMEYFQLFI